MINTLSQPLSGTVQGGQGEGKWKKMTSLDIDWAINHCPFSINHGRWQKQAGTHGKWHTVHDGNRGSQQTAGKKEVAPCPAVPKGGRLLALHLRFTSAWQLSPVKPAVKVWRSPGKFPTSQLDWMGPSRDVFFSSGVEAVVGRVCIMWVSECWEQ